MRLMLVFAVACALSFGAGWEAVERLTPDQKVEVTTRDGTRDRGTLVRATSDSLTLRLNSGERSVPRADVRQVRVSDPNRRVRHGLIWTAVGVGAGVGIGWAVCPGCANEGAPYQYIGPGIGIGAAVGALGFLTSPYRVVYKSR